MTTKPKTKRTVRAKFYMYEFELADLLSGEAGEFTVYSHWRAAWHAQAGRGPIVAVSVKPLPRTSSKTTKR